MTKMKRIVSFVLAFVLFASVCTNGLIPSFAAGSEATLTAVPAGITPTEESLGTQVAYVANDTVTVYEYYKNGALGMVCTGALGEQIELTKKFTYTVDGVETVIYHFADSDFAGAMGAADVANYQFILASDVTFTAPEVTPDSEMNETEITDSNTNDTTNEKTAAVKNFITDHGAITSQDYYDTGEEPTATIKNNPVAVYDGFEDGAKYLDLADVNGATVSLGQKIVYNDTTVLYRFSCDSTNTALHDAYSDGYFFILAKDVDVATSGGSATTPDTTPTIPDNPTLTEGADVSIVDATGAPVTDAGLKVREGAKISLSAWTGLTDVGDETYQWQIFSEETSGAWVNINGQQSKGLLMSLGMVNSMTVPSIRCKIVTGGATKYSQAIPVTALKDDTFTDDSSNVSVAGVLPIDAKLTVSNTNAAATGLNNGVYPVGSASLFNDVTLTRGGSTYQPEDGENVTITFPESAVTSTGFAAGDAYHVYHIHDGVVDLSEIKQYNGGDVKMTFSNLSVVGISEATAAEKDLVEQHGAITNQKSISLILYIKNDSVVLYDTPESTGEATAYTTTITGCAGAEVEATQKITYEDGFVVYRVCGTENTPADLSSTLTAYPIISADDVSEEATEETVVINTCAICGKEMGTVCVTPHVYCTECKTFDCGETHKQPATEKPVTAPVIPANPTLTSGADVTIVDEEGSPVTGTYTLYEGTRASLSAWDDNSTANDGSFQWQICYDTENNLWVNIQGQTTQGIVISPAMFVGMQDTAYLRCVMNGNLTSDAISVNITEQPIAASFNLQSNARNGIATVADTGTLTNYNVVINYVFENNVVVADSYTATLAAGSSFSATVKHPTVMGYLPYVGTETETSAEIELNITNIQADVTYTVTYKPTNVDYTVIHYWQNVDNDNFTVHERETKQGLTNSQVPEVAKNYPGFYKLLYERPEIAADGSTVVEIYYDREYYLMIFNLGEGGYGVEPIYARYGTPVEIGTPTRPGYTFTGWDKDVPSTVPVNGGRYTAQWTVKDTAKVKVVIWGENPNDEEYSYLTTGELMLKPNTEYTYNGTDQLYLYCDKEAHTHANCELTCGKTEHTVHTDDCLGCGQVYHAHNVTCYTEDGEKFSEDLMEHYVNGTSTNGFIGESYNRWYGATGNKYIYIDGSWYKYSGNASVGDTVSPSCGQQENLHEHNDSCYTCETHAHTDACYECGKEEHSHDSNCTGTVEGLDSTLWTFVKSDTIMVNPNGSSVINVYYDRTSFTMTFKEEGYNGDTLATITDKWGADIKTRFETISKANTFFWSTSRNGGSPWTSFMDVMPAENRTYYADNQSGSTTITATYLAENLEGTGYETLYTVSFKGSSGITVTKEEFVDIEGFTFNDSLSTDVGERYNGSKFYYDRHNYNIEFYNPTTLLKTETGVPYQSPLSSYDWTPDASMAPDKYEPGSVEFEGWYLNPECTGDKFDFTAHTMPAGTNDGDTTLTLYAKWAPVTRTVTFFLDKETMENGGKALGTRTTPHGSLIDLVDEPPNGGYTFNGWYYMDDGVEKRFLFETMVITKDMDVYAKWSSNVLKEYVVYFKSQDTGTQIADPITGSTRAGLTKTFDAKVGTDLYEGYQEGYFPVVKSHSMTLDINTPEKAGTDANGTEWVEITNADGTKKIVQSFTFWYVQKDEVPYTVYYVAETLKDGGTSLGTIERNGKTYYIIAQTEEHKDNRKAVVTEKFKQVSGYMPDAYQKRLVVDGTDGAVNEIIFYYSVDSTHAYYKITHYTQNTDGETWTEYASSQAVGEIGQTYTADPMTIDGFTYDSNVAGTVESGKLTANGLELKLYYVRNEYPYEVRYLEQGSGKELADPITGTGLYGGVVSESAINIENYTAVDPTSQTLTIKIEESQTVAKLNIITFYYEEKEATINYEVVGPDGCGTVSLPSETVKVLTGTAAGSTATANQNYRFVGWYSDHDCTNEVSNNATYMPTKPEDGWKNATYYAKFELDVADLTITKSGNISSYDEGQSFIFRVTGPDGFSLDVVINGTGSVTIKDLPIGTYTVTEITNWSWRYTPDSKTATKTLAAGTNEVIFNNTRNGNIYWLSGDSFKENQFTVKPKDEDN